jgi:hypothetical protein
MAQSFGSWAVLTTAFLTLLYLALGGVTFSAVLQLCNAKWRFQVRKLACSFAALLPIAGILLVILLSNGEHTFAWLSGGQAEGHHLNGWHNYTFLVTREIVAFLAVVALCGLFIRYQYLSEIDSSYRTQRRFRNITILIPFMYFAYGSMVGWDFEMTQIPLWHSASYGAYHFQSGFHMFLAFFAVFLYLMNKYGRLAQPIEPKIFNYMAQFILAMTILWTYLYFTQYLIFWYGRLPDDFDRYRHMMYEGFGPLWWTYLALKFVIPLCTLVLTPNRHNPPVIATVAGCIVVGYWIERYVWIAGSVDPQYYHMPMTSMFDIVVTLVVAGVAWWAVRLTLLKSGLMRAPAGEAVLPSSSEESP